jgi:hypothetical protein
VPEVPRGNVLAGLALFACRLACYHEVCRLTHIMRGLFCFFVQALGATTSDVCDPCGVGSWSNAQGATECTLCVKGTYSTSEGGADETTCTPCPAGWLFCPCHCLVLVLSLCVHVCVCVCGRTRAI